MTVVKSQHDIMMENIMRDANRGAETANAADESSQSGEDEGEEEEVDLDTEVLEHGEEHEEL
jgi:hypothetical protein